MLINPKNLWDVFNSLRILGFIGLYLVLFPLVVSAKIITFVPEFD